MTAIGCVVCYKTLPSLPNKDPGWIVIDEWAGQWLCLAIIIPFAGIGWISFLVGFIAFRLFDITKPWPISWTERTGPAWWSIMADDLAAGLIGGAMIVLIYMVVL